MCERCFHDNLLPSQFQSCFHTILDDLENVLIKNMPPENFLYQDKPSSKLRNKQIIWPRLYNVNYSLNLLLSYFWNIKMHHELIEGNYELCYHILALGKILLTLWNTNNQSEVCNSVKFIQGAFKLRSDFFS